ncbi:FAD/NAD(P)-binding protein [Streptomyces sp. SID13031]|uniref:FAD/NAD(P)-binding protein n=1 Tax=Streptomyces sp. SID13031 TaxID=2706046 RepID=UPI0013C6129B|nr:FAD/NAD(P)-binding protein [Streptomyces sp. SID13031]NEA33605.1 FAD/NAD(P)-binding protein [Streptomyces sp. SID13031]
MGGHYAPGSSVTVAIVGMGVRGLSVLERIISQAALVDPLLRIDLHLVDGNPAQPRQYDSHQPDYLLLNHACAQVSMFPAAQSVTHAPAMSGPSLYDWVRERGLRVASDGFTVGNDGRQVRPTDNLPRRVFGDYLRWFLEHLRTNAPDNVRLIDHASDAVDLKQDGDTAILSLGNGDHVEADYLFVTVGQRPQPAPRDRDRSSSRLIATAYPLPGQFASIQPSETVAVAGLGLTAADAIFALTVGRGGSFDQTVSPERYLPSGREPRIIVFSRSGLPYRARPTPSPCVSYDAVALTRTAIDRLRTRTPRLDFDRDVLPLLLLELRVAYQRAKLLQEAGEQAAEAFLLSARGAAAEGVLDTFAELPGPAEFDAETVYRGTVATSAEVDGRAYQRSLESWLTADLADAMRGFEGSPVKAATEICREFRDIIRYAIEFGGLTDASLDRFYRHHREAINRLVIGPEKERSGNLLTLLRSGLVSMPVGPNPLVDWDDDTGTWTLSSTALSVPQTVSADWLYRGYTDRITSVEDDPAVVGAIARRGIARRFKPASTVVSSVEVDGCGHPIAENGESAARIWIFGLLCEGVTFYNGYLTSPERFERSQSDADRAVHELIEEVRPDRQIISALEGGARR